MSNILRLFEAPDLNYERYFEVMRDFRKGGLTPDIYDEFIATSKELPIINKRSLEDYRIFEKFNLIDVSQEDLTIIVKEVTRRNIEGSKKCWHPLASSEECNTDNENKIIISAAHSIQNNGVLSNIVDNGHVMSYTFKNDGFNGNKVSKNVASIFWGFCNKHDAIFRPIENFPYTFTEEQNFLFAYRGFVVAAHKKFEASNSMNFTGSWDKDLEETKKIFDNSIINEEYSVIHTELFELPAFYPIAVSSAFYLEFDFKGKLITHSDDRMEYLYVTILPSIDKTYFMLSYFKQDSVIYGELGNQLRERNNLKSDISMLIASHVENVFFNPLYYQTFIEKYESELQAIMFEAQMNFAAIDDNNQIGSQISATPNNYLDNKKNINFFGY